MWLKIFQFYKGIFWGIKILILQFENILIKIKLYMPLTDHCLCMFLKFDEKNKDVEME